jgi:hypothetical protein
MASARHSFAPEPTPVTDNPPLERTAAAVYLLCGRASRVCRRGRSTALRYAGHAPMTEADLLLIERMLSITLPTDYRELMLGATYEDRSDDPLAMWAMPNDPKAVIDWNLEFRLEGFILEPWPESWFTFGHNGCGDHYFIDLRLGSRPVFCKSHEGDGVREVASDLRTFVDECRREWEEAGREVARREAEDPALAAFNPIMIDEVVPSGKKWWQFWKRRLIHRRY